MLTTDANTSDRRSQPVAYQFAVFVLGTIPGFLAGLVGVLCLGAAGAGSVKLGWSVLAVAVLATVTCVVQIRGVYFKLLFLAGLVAGVASCFVGLYWLVSGMVPTGQAG